ncbi:MAG: hypothetical protein AB8B55_24135 [Mariniblastus sp.]
MEPFSIICKSCAAKLKVTKPSAVGQILGCPKCGTMLEVVPPEGWVPPTPEPSESQVQPMTDDFGGDFEDIDKILSAPTQPAKQQRAGRPPAPGQPQRKKQPRNPKQVAGQTPATAANGGTSAAAPVLPNEQWTSEGTKKRRSRVNKIVGILGALVLLGAVGAAIWFNLQKPTPAVANNDDVPAENVDQKNGDQANGELDPNKQNLLDENPIAGIDANPIAANPIAANPNGANPMGPGVISNEIKTPPEFPDNVLVPATGQPVDGQPAVPGAINDDPNIAQANPDGSAVAPANAPDLGNPDANKPPPKFAPGIGQLSPPPLIEPGNSNAPIIPQTPADDRPLIGKTPIDPIPKSSATEIEIEDKLGELSAYLEGQGSSLLEIEDIAAAIRRRPVIGIPKYIVDRAEIEELQELANLNLEEQLQLPLGGVQFKNIPLANALRTISRVTGIPITLDVRSIANGGGSPNPMLTGELIKDKTVGEVIDELLGTLTKIENQVLLRITSPQSGELVETKIAFPQVPGIDEAGKARFLSSVQSFVEPESWNQEDNPGMIRIEGDQIVANCTEQVKHQLERYIAKVQAAVDLLKNPDDNQARMTLESKWKSAQPTLAKNPQLVHGIRLDIDSFLNKLHKNTGATITVDWASVLAKGWTPQMRLPGNVSEPTLEELLMELTQSLGLSVIAVDEQTFFLTTYENEAKLEDLEIYSVAKIVDVKMKEPLLMRQLQKIVGSQPGQFVYDEKTKSIIAIAPQSVQRQVEAVLDRFGEL